MKLEAKLQGQDERKKNESRKTFPKLLTRCACIFTHSFTPDAPDIKDTLQLHQQPSATQPGIPFSLPSPPPPHPPICRYELYDPFSRLSGKSSSRCTVIQMMLIPYHETHKHNFLLLHKLYRVPAKVEDETWGKESG